MLNVKSLAIGCDAAHHGASIILHPRGFSRLTAFGHSAATLFSQSEALPASDWDAGAGLLATPPPPARASQLILPQAIKLSAWNKIECMLPAGGRVCHLLRELRADVDGHL